MISLLGISVYLGNDLIEDVEFKIEKAKQAGFTSIFTSLHIPEDNPQLYKVRLRMLGAVARKNHMELMADISSKSLGYLGFTWENAEGLLDWGLTGLRADDGISNEAIVRLSQKMKVALNASTLTENGLRQLKEAGLCLKSAEAWHNFYPRPETGLDHKHFKQINKWLREEGITVMAFIPGDGRLRGPLFKGLPTLEKHRKYAPFTAYLELVEKYFVNKVLIGDLTLSDETLEQFTTYQEGVILLRAEQAISNSELFQRIETIQTNRQDEARDCIRSLESRVNQLIENRPIHALNTVNRPLGTITVDNKKYERYEGEIQITKRDLPADNKVNVIGRIKKSDRVLLQYVRGGVKFKIKWMKKDKNTNASQ